LQGDLGVKVLNTLSLPLSIPVTHASTSSSLSSAGTSFSLSGTASLPLLTKDMNDDVVVFLEASVDLAMT
jgi:hypothetical protein